MIDEMFHKVVKKYRTPFIVVLLVCFFTLFYFYLNDPKNLDLWKDFSSRHIILGGVLLFIYRIIALIIPPLPGGVVSLALTPVFGWWYSWIIESVAVIIGSTIAFFLARKYRENLVKRFVPLKKLHEIQDDIASHTEFVAFVFIRFFTGPILDFVSYVAGLSKISYLKFILATAFTLIPEAGTFYFTEFFFNNFSNQSHYFGIVSATMIVLLLILLNKHYKKKLNKNK